MMAKIGYNVINVKDGCIRNVLMCFYREPIIIMAILMGKMFRMLAISVSNVEKFKVNNRSYPKEMHS